MFAEVSEERSHGYEEYYLLGRYIPPKHRFTFNGFYGVMSQKIALFVSKRLADYIE
jgi:hypothetical protein